METDSVPNVSYMFNGCTSLTELKINKLSTINATNKSGFIPATSTATIYYNENLIDSSIVQSAPNATWVNVAA